MIMADTDFYSENFQRKYREIRVFRCEFFADVRLKLHICAFHFENFAFV